MLLRTPSQPAAVHVHGLHSETGSGYPGNPQMKGEKLLSYVHLRLAGRDRIPGRFRRGKRIHGEILKSFQKKINQKVEFVFF